MAIFTKKDDLEQEASRVSKEAISCIISKEMRITGEIEFKGKARIDGTINGDIRGEYLVLSETGVIHGDVELGALICHGTIEGNITAKLVTAHQTAVICGTLTAGSLTVEPGAVLEGEIHASSRDRLNKSPAGASTAQKERKNLPPAKNGEAEKKEDKTA